MLFSKNKEIAIIGLQDIEEIIVLTLWSGYLENEVPVSLMVCAEVEAGKSELVKLYADNHGVVFPHDLTAWGLVKAYSLRLLKSEIRHIIFPEFVHCLARQKETVQTLLSFLNGLIAEGVREIHTYTTNIDFPRPLSAGIIACLTTDEMHKWRHEWEASGFLSRLLPLSYSYSERVEADIFEALFAREHTQQASIFLALPSKPQAVFLSKRLARELKPISKEVGRVLRIRGFRPQLQLQKLCMARALSQGRHEVTEEDIIRVQYLASQYINLEFRPV